MSSLIDYILTHYKGKVKQSAVKETGVSHHRLNKCFAIIGFRYWKNCVPKSLMSIKLMDKNLYEDQQWTKQYLARTNLFEFCWPFLLLVCSHFIGLYWRLVDVETTPRVYWDTSILSHLTLNVLRLNRQNFTQVWVKQSSEILISGNSLITWQ